MVFSLREAVGGFKHMGVGLKRKFARRPETFFLPRFESNGVKAHRFETWQGTPAICPICGYALIRVELPEGWSFDTCSAMPSITALESEQFAKWAESLVSTKLPTARV